MYFYFKDNFGKKREKKFGGSEGLEDGGLVTCEDKDLDVEKERNGQDLGKED